MRTLKDLQVTLPFFMNRCWVLSVSDSVFLYSFVLYKLIFSKSYILCFLQFRIIQIDIFQIVCSLTSYVSLPLKPTIGLLSAMATIIVSLLVNSVSRKKGFFPTQRLTMHVTSLPCFISCPFFTWRIIMSPQHILLSPTPPCWESKTPVNPLWTNNPSMSIRLVVSTRNCVDSSLTTFLSRLYSTIGTPSLLKLLLHLMRRWLRKM